MAKYCNFCGGKIGYFSEQIPFKDGMMDKKCLTKYGMGSAASMRYAKKHTVQEFKDLIASGKTFKDVQSEYLTDREKKQAANDAKYDEQKKEYEADVAATNFKSPSNSSTIKKAAGKINKLRMPKEIKKQLIDAEVFDFWFNNRELKELPNIVEYQNGEVIKYAASGLKEINDSTRTVLILCTNRRVIFLNKNIIFGGDSTDIPLNMVNSVQLTTHLVLADISIINGSTTTTLKDLGKNAAKILSKTIKQQMFEFQKQMYQPQVVQAENTNPDSASEIRKFKKLADDGIITQDEFEAKKKQLLGL